MAQELLVTFEQDIGSVTLVPGTGGHATGGVPGTGGIVATGGVPGTGGIFEIRLDGVLIWSRAEQARFPEIKELKRLVRDRVAPGRDLGHVDH